MIRHRTVIQYDIRWFSMGFLHEPQEQHKKAKSPVRYKPQTAAQRRASAEDDLLIEEHLARVWR